MIIDTDDLTIGESFITAIDKITSKKNGLSYLMINCITKRYDGDLCDAGVIVVDEENPLFNREFTVGESGIFVFVGSGSSS